MPNSALSPGRLSRLSTGSARRASSLLGASVLLGVMAALAPEPLIQLGLSVAATVLMGLGFAVTLSARQIRSKQASTMTAIGDFIEKDASPSFVCTPDGEVLRANAAARTTYATRRGETLAGTLRNTFANPGGILFRL